MSDNRDSVQKLSSEMTWIVQIVAPLILAGLILAVAVPTWLSRAVTWHDLLDLAVPIALLAWPAWILVRLRQVSIAQQDGLVVSGSHGELFVRFSEILKVGQFPLTGFTVLVTLVLKNDTKYGKKIRFVARGAYRGWRGYTHPDVLVLRDRIKSV